MSHGIWVSEREFVRFSESSAMTTTDMASHMATRLRAGDLSGFLGILPNPDPILKRMGKDIQVYRDLIADSNVKSGVRRRRAAVVSMEHGFARQTTATVRTVRNLVDVFADLPIEKTIEEAVSGSLFGYAVAEVIWGKSAGGPVPVDLVVKPSEWFGFDNENRLVLREAGSLKGTVAPDRKFIVLGNGSYANPYGEPDLASCFWPVQFRRGGLKFWVTFAEKYGMPWAIGKQPRSAGQPDADKLADKLEAMVRDAVAVIPNDASVELHQANTTANADMFQQLLMYCSREINISLLGNNQSTEQDANRASATAAAGVEASLRNADAKMVAGGLSALARWICETRWPSAQPAAYEFWEQEDIDTNQATRDETLTKAGVKFKAAYWKRNYNLQDGDIEEDPQPGRPGDGGVAFAEGDVPADQAALDAAIDDLPGDELHDAMQALLAPALEAIGQAKTPDEVMAALTEAYPKMDSMGLQKLLHNAFFVADVVGRVGVEQEAQAD